MIENSPGKQGKFLQNPGGGTIKIVNAVKIVYL